MEAEAILSLWIGHFGSEDELFEYVDFVYDDDGNSTCPFAVDVGILWFDHDFQEAQFVKEGLSNPEKVLAGHSWSSSFSAIAAAAIAHAKQTQDNALFILYDFAYDPAAARPGSEGRLRFVGTFAYAEGESLR